MTLTSSTYRSSLSEAAGIGVTGLDASVICPSFLAGAALHTGPGIFEVSHGIVALPSSSIWA